MNARDCLFAAARKKILAVRVAKMIGVVVVVVVVALIFQRRSLVN